jgi:preprotein translocase subunit SecG
MRKILLMVAVATLAGLVMFAQDKGGGKGGPGGGKAGPRLAVR